jgi:hypothetical protein
MPAAATYNTTHAAYYCICIVCAVVLVVVCIYVYKILSAAVEAIYGILYPFADVQQLQVPPLEVQVSTSCTSHTAILTHNCYR